MKHILFLFILLFSVPALAFETPAKQAIIIDYETGTILFEKNAAERMPTSSMSKVMTMYMVFDAIKKGEIALDSTFKVSEKAWRKGGSKMFIKVGDDVKVEDLIRGVIIQSGNDATIALAEGLAGSEDTFGAQMTRMAKGLGMQSSNFTNASGWPDENHYSTAWDLALLGRRLINDFPEFYPYYAETEYTYNDIKQANRNPLLHQGIGGDGIKTGHTDDGGYGLIGSGVQNNRRVVFVVNGLDSVKERAEQAKSMLLYGLNNFKNETLYKAGQNVENVPVLLGQEDQVTASVTNDLRITLPKNADRNVLIKTEFQSPLMAPIAAGQEIGKITIAAPGQPDTARPLVAAQAVDEVGFIGRILAKAHLLMFGT